MALSLDRIFVEFAFGDTWTTASPTWTDVTKYVRSVTTKRGRQHELDVVAAGTAVVDLDNRDGRFRPLNTAGAYSPDVVPGVPVRFRARYDSTDYDVWRGFVESWPQTYPGKLDAVARASCVDGFKWLGHASVDRYLTTIENASPVYWWKLDETTGTLAEDSGRATTPIDLTYAGGYTLNQTPAWGPSTGSKGVDFDGVDGVVSAASGATEISPTSPFSIEGWVQADGTVGQGGLLTLARDGTTATWGIVIASSGGLNIVLGDKIQAAGLVDVSGLWSHFVVTMGPTALISFYVDGVLQDIEPYIGDRSGVAAQMTDTAIGNRATLQDFDGEAAHIALYDREMNATEVFEHYRARYDTFATAETVDVRLNAYLDWLEWPSGIRDIDTGISALTASAATGQLLSVMREASLDDGGVLVMRRDGDVGFDARFTRAAVKDATFGDRTSDTLQYQDIVLGYDDSTIINLSRVTGVGGINETSHDATSITTNGHRYLDQSRHLNTDDAQGLADWIVSRRKDPQYRVQSITINPERNPTAEWPQVLTRDIGDWIEVVRTASGDALTHDTYIEKITNKYTPESWTTTWELSPESFEQVWQLGTTGRTELGTTTVLGW